jgi:hypothetical protein
MAVRQDIALFLEVKGVDDTVNRIAELNLELKEVQAQMKQAQKAGDQVTFTRLKKEQLGLREELKGLNAEFRKQAKDFKSIDFAPDSLVQLRKRYRDLSAEVARTGRSDPKFKEKAAEAKKLKDEIDKIGEEIGDFRSQVGSYAQAIERTLGSSGGLISGIIGDILPVIGPGGTLLGGLAAIGAIAEPIRQVALEFVNLRGAVQQLTGAQGAELDEYTVRVKALSDTFGKDFNEVLLATNNFAKQSKIEIGEALDEIERGFIQGADANGEFLDNLKEYPVQLRDTGATAQETINIITEQVQQGFFSDKLVDSLKEANISIKEFTTATRDALAPLGPEFVTQIEQGVKDGSLTAIDALDLISKEAAKKGLDLQQLQTITADVFRGAGEDAGKWQELVSVAFEATTKSAQDYIDRAGETAERQARQLELQKQLAGAQNELSKELAGFVVSTRELGTKALTVVIAGVTKFIQVIKSTIDFLQENKTEIAAVGVALIALNANYIASAVNVVRYTAVQKAQTIATTAMTVAQRALNIAMRANPIGLIITAIGLLIAGFGAAYKSSVRFRASIDGIASLAKETFAIIKEAVAQFVEGWEALSEGNFKEAFKKFGSGLTKANPINIAFREGDRLKQAFNDGYNKTVAAAKVEEEQKEIEKKLANFDQTAALAKEKGKQLGDDLNAGLKSTTGGTLKALKERRDLITQELDNIPIGSEQYKEKQRELQEVIKQINQASKEYESEIRESFEITDKIINVSVANMKARLGELRQEIENASTQNEIRKKLEQIIKLEDNIKSTEDSVKRLKAELRGELIDENIDINDQLKFNEQLTEEQAERQLRLIELRKQKELEALNEVSRFQLTEQEDRVQRTISGIEARIEQEKDAERQIQEARQSTIGVDEDLIQSGQQTQDQLTQSAERGAAERIDIASQSADAILLQEQRIQPTSTRDAIVEQERELAGERIQIVTSSIDLVLSQEARRNSLPTSTIAEQTQGIENERIRIVQEASDQVLENEEGFVSARLKQANELTDVLGSSEAEVQGERLRAMENGIEGVIDLEQSASDQRISIEGQTVDGITDQIDKLNEARLQVDTAVEEEQAIANQRVNIEQFVTAAIIDERGRQGQPANLSPIVQESQRVSDQRIDIEQETVQTIGEINEALARTTNDDIISVEEEIGDRRIAIAEEVTKVIADQEGVVLEAQETASSQRVDIQRSTVDQIIEDENRLKGVRVVEDVTDQEQAISSRRIAIATQATDAILREQSRLNEGLVTNEEIVASEQVVSSNRILLQKQVTDEALKELDKQLEKEKAVQVSRIELAAQRVDRIVGEEERLTTLQGTTTLLDQERQTSESRVQLAEQTTDSLLSQNDRLNEGVTISTDVLSEQEQLAQNRVRLEENVTDVLRGQFTEQAAIQGQSIESRTEAVKTGVDQIVSDYSRLANVETVVDQNDEALRIANDRVRISSNATDQVIEDADRLKQVQTFTDDTSQLRQVAAERVRINQQSTDQIIDQQNEVISNQEDISSQLIDLEQQVSDEVISQNQRITELREAFDPTVQEKAISEERISIAGNTIDSILSEEARLGNSLQSTFDPTGEEQEIARQRLQIAEGVTDALLSENARLNEGQVVQTAILQEQRTLEQEKIDAVQQSTDEILATQQQSGEQRIQIEEQVTNAIIEQTQRLTEEREINTLISDQELQEGQTRIEQEKQVTDSIIGERERLASVTAGNNQLTTEQQDSQARIALSQSTTDDLIQDAERLNESRANVSNFVRPEEEAQRQRVQVTENTSERIIAAEQRISDVVTTEQEQIRQQFTETANVRDSLSGSVEIQTNVQAEQTGGNEVSLQARLQEQRAILEDIRQRRLAIDEEIRQAAEQTNTIILKTEQERVQQERLINLRAQRDELRTAIANEKTKAEERVRARNELREVEDQIAETSGTVELNRRLNAIEVIKETRIAEASNEIKDKEQLERELQIIELQASAQTIRAKLAFRELEQKERKRLANELKALEGEIGESTENQVETTALDDALQAIELNKQQRINAILQSGQAEEEIRRQISEVELDAEEKTLAAKLGLQKLTEEERLKLTNERIRKQQELEEAGLTSLQLAWEDAFEKIKQASVQFVVDRLSAGIENEKRALEEQTEARLQASEEQLNAELEQLEKDKDEKALTEEGYQNRKLQLEKEAEERRLEIEKEAAEKRKEIAKKEALISAAQAAIKTAALIGFIPALIPALAALAATTALQIATIEGQEFADSGKVGEGPMIDIGGMLGNISLGGGSFARIQKTKPGRLSGPANIPKTPKGDDMLVVAHRGEMMIDKRRQRLAEMIYGRDIWKMLRIPGYADSGVVGGDIPTIINVPDALAEEGRQSKLEVRFSDEQMKQFAKIVGIETASQTSTQVSEVINIENRRNRDFMRAEKKTEG